MKLKNLLSTTCITFICSFSTYAGVGEGISETGTLSSIIPIIVIPGIEGSPLYDDKNDDNFLKPKERIWMDLDKLTFSISDGFLDVLQLAENGIDPYNPLYKIKVSPLQDDAGWTIEDELDFPSYPSHLYEGLIDFIRNSRPGFSLDNFDSIHLKDENLFIFNYDWRKSNNYNGELLSQLISSVLQLTNSPKVILIAHSMGGFVAKSCITDPTFDKSKVDKIFFLGTPNLGAPKILYVTLTGDIDFPWLPDPNKNEIIKISRNMPSAYSLFPSENYFITSIFNGISTGRYLYSSCFLDPGKIDLNYSGIQQYFKNVSLGSGITLNSTLIDVADVYRSTIQDVDFGSIQVYNIVGFDLPTISKVKDKINGSGSHKPKLELNLTGDGTVPMRSAEAINLSLKKANYYIKDMEHTGLPSSSETATILGRLLFDLDTTGLATETIWDHPPASYAAPTFFQIALNGPGKGFIKNIGNGIQTKHFDLGSDNSDVSDSTIGTFESDFIINAKVKEEILISDLSSNGQYNLWIGLFDKGELVNEQFTQPIELSKDCKIFIDLNEVNNHFNIKIDINGDGKIDANILTAGNSNLEKEVVIFPLEYSLSQNFPNPFNPITQIHYAIPEKGFVSLKVYDILGKEVAALVSEEKEPGFYTVDFNGNELSSGLYVYRIQAGNFIQSKKMILMK